MTALKRGALTLDIIQATPYHTPMDNRPNSLAFVVLLALLLLGGLASAAQRRAPAPEGKADGTITLFRPDKNERGTFAYRDREGRLDVRVLEKINRFFRCRLTDEVHEIDPQLIVALDRISDHFGGKEVEIISSYRSPTRNALMRRQGRRVAKNSLHMRGKAADIEIRGVSAEEIRNFAYALKEGGVGYYGKHSFVHVDTGALRTWGWKPPASPRTAAASK